MPTAKVTTKQEAVDALISFAASDREEWAAVPMIIRDLAYNVPERKLRYFLACYEEMRAERDAARDAADVASRRAADHIWRRNGKEEGGDET